MLFISCPIFSQTDIKKEAAKLFEDEDYTKAYKFYSQLVANYPKDPEYNFKLGVCMIFSEPDKKKSLPYLLFAKRNPGDETKDAVFWLGKAYHINYLFDEAIKNYDEYKRTASSSKLKKLQVDREIRACINGKKLLSNLTDLVVTSKKELNEADYFRSYDLKDIGGKLLAKPDDFKSSSDKKKKDASIVFLPKNSNRVYYSSFGDNPENGRDIYFSVKLANGTFSKGEKVKGINTEFDEDYPFLHPNGQTLYFASKGHNSMGGYDIFKSTYIEASDSWGTPVNLEFPVNSPDDDYLFVTDSLEKVAYFSTGRQSPPGKIDVLRINTERKPIDILAMKGTVTKGTEEQGFKSVISIKNMADESAVGTFTASDEGNYTLELPNGSRLLFTVATPGMKTQSEEINLPLVTISKPFRQIIGYQDGILKITNYFDEEPTEENYLQYLKVIEKKAKLDVNEGENKLAPAATLSVTSTASDKKNSKSNSSSPQLVDSSVPETTTTSTNSTKGLDNKQLADIAKQDALELQQEVTQLKQDSKDALEVGAQQKESAERKLISANEQLKAAESIQNEDDKKQAIEKATQLKQEAEQEAALATKILAFGKSMEEDASLKQKEAQLNDSYSKELEKSINSKDNSSATKSKLDDLQKQISSLSEQKNKSEDIFNAIKTEIEDKEKQLSGLEQKKSDINLNLAEIKTSITENEADLAKTKKKKDKEIILTQTNELKADQQEKENQLATNENEIKKITDELDALKNELNLANKIKTETIAAVETNSTAIAVNTATTAVKPAKEPIKSLASAKKTEKTKTSTPKTTTPLKTQDKLSYAPLSAKTSTEAIVKLDNLDKQLSATTDREIFDFNGYQSPQAQNLKIEADAKINEATLQQKTVKETIVSSKEVITLAPAGGQPVITQAQLTKEADNLVIKAQALRTESDKKDGEEKEKLLNEAKELEAKADEKYIAASDITKNDNKVVFDANSENIQDLLATNKSSEFDLANARKLNEEAAVSFKQAANIREEANSLASAGAKLGSLSNAEEIEAEAIIKQKEAVEILKKANPDLALITPVTSNNPSTIASTDPTVIAGGLEKVNLAVSDLVNIRIQSYQKLYDANTAEIEQVSSSIAGNQATLDKTPGLKNEFSASAVKLQTVRTLKQKSDDSSAPDEKLSALTDAIKKQLDVIKQLNKVNTSLNKIVESNTAIVQQNNNPTVQKNTPTAVKGPTVQTESGPTPTVVNNVIEEKITPPSKVEVINVEALLKEDTTSGQLVNYLNKNITTLKNAQAEAAVKKSLSDLKSTSNEISALEEKIKNYQPGEATVENSVELKSKSDNLLVEAETLSGRAFAARTESNGKTGEEKDTLIARSEILEKTSDAKKLEAAALTLQASDLDYKTNSNAISELLEKLKTDNPGLAAELLTKNNESKILYDQTKLLRNEANSLDNIPARLGAISNVEEKEAETNQKQVLLLGELKKIYPDYVVKAAVPETPESMEAKKNQLLEKQYADLTELTNSFSLEYEASKNSVPENLSEDQNLVKQNADELNSESKRLLVQASQQNNSSEKIKLLNLSAKAGNSAVAQLNKLIPIEKVASVKKPSGKDELKNIGKSIADTNKPTKETQKPAAKNTATTSNSKTTLQVQGLEVLKGNAYNANRPIPIDSKIEDGLIFRVQIGAFKTRLPDNAFKGLTPLNGETTNSGYIRYTAGNFNKIENANAVKNDLRGLGYSDAFVVVYYNGKRISLNEALEIMNREGKTIDANAPASAGITANSNIPKATAPVLNPNLTTEDKVIVTDELEKLNGLLYTVQIGVYTKQTTNNQLLNLKPIFTERLTNGLYRYTAGIYSSTERLISDKNKVIIFGVKDAFVSAYINGKRVPFSEAKQRQAEDSTIKTEAENPIIFPDASTIISPVVASTTMALPATSSFQPFKNDVTAYPTATEENGVKPTEEGITFKVQIGAYSRQVPEDIAAKFSEIKTWPVENKQINSLYIYNIGSFTEPKFAKALKEEIVKLGINDAFITVYRDGVKLYGTEAASLLAR